MKYALLALLFIASAIAGNDIVPASNSATDVQAAIDNAGTVDGDRILIPAGSPTYTKTVKVNKALIIDGQGTLTIKDAVLTANRPSGLTANQGEAIFTFLTTTGKDYRLTGITFEDGGRGSEFFNGMIQFWGTSWNNRIDNCHWLDSAIEANHARLMYLRDATYGVVHNCTSTLSGTQFFTIGGHNLYGLSDGNGPWTQADKPGSAEMWVIEDCTFSGGTDSFGGGRYCVRHCNVNTTTLVGHGTESSHATRGVRWMEIYSNVFTTTTASRRGINYRSGSGVFYSNTGNVSGAGSWANIVYLTCHRFQDQFYPWGGSDGSSAFDNNDTTDGPGTPGGAGDGVFESGTATSGGSLSLTDTGKSWQANQWAGYSLRSIADSGTATSGTTGDLLVDSGKGWSNNQWATNDKFSVRNKTTNQSWEVGSNDGTSITFSTSGTFALSPGDQYEIYYFARIVSNTASTLTLDGSAFRQNISVAAGDPYEIRRVVDALDQPGVGQSTAFTGSNTPSPIAWPSQARSPIYIWGNTFTGSPPVVGADAGIRVTDHYVTGTARPEYLALAYPHFLRPVAAAAGARRPAAARRTILGQ